MKNLKIAAIIAEYNPFHNGHLYHIRKAKEIFDYIIIIMSGNFVQRGEPAIINKFARTKMALLGGADVVIELNSVAATHSAEGFAKGAINLIDSCNIAQFICYGAEDDNLKDHQEIAKILAFENDAYKFLLRQELSKGLSYPKARYNALKEICPKIADIINSPNNILSVEYLKAILSQNSNLEPVLIKRQGGEHNSQNIGVDYASATAIRNHMNSNQPITDLEPFMPSYSLNILQKSSKNTLDNYSQIFQYILKTKGLLAFDGISIEEGLKIRIINAAAKEYKISNIINLAKTKRYTYSSIKRAIMQVLLEINKNDAINPHFIRILGFRKQSQILLKLLKQHSKLPIVINLQNAPEEIKPELEKELKISSLYHINEPAYNEYFQKIVIK